ncbi:hypothetical protein ABT324_02675 [Saccharopolyspora sp. NPDC000359]|uniref:hypothetical protein n=1 Tax=Saccharopolyspora sp. NPDC000359 TaxID=3154251 RepID=UPI003324EE75
MSTTARDLLRLPLAELQAMARERRDHTRGTTVTYSPNVFIPLTNLCRDRCDALPGQDLHRPVAGLPRDGARGGPAVQRHHDVRRDRAALSWARHFIATRGLQRRTGGFTEFVGLPFVHMAAPMYLRRQARRGPTWREVVLVRAVARIVYSGLTDNVQGSWVKLGAPALRQLLRSGVNDLGGTLMDENISRAVGAAHGQMMTESEFAALLAPLGRSLARRTTLYQSIPADVAVGA